MIAVDDPPVASEGRYAVEYACRRGNLDLPMKSAPKGHDVSLRLVNESTQRTDAGVWSVISPPGFVGQAEGFTTEGKGFGLTEGLRWTGRSGKACEASMTFSAVMGKNGPSMWFDIGRDGLSTCTPVSEHEISKGSKS